MNKFMNALSADANLVRTENGALTRRSSNLALLDLFALGGAYRSRSEEDCIFLFKKAYDENPLYALKCLFYLRDVRGGQGERRFFRAVMKWLASYDTEAVRRNLKYIPEYGRYDDLYTLVGTPLEDEVFAFIKLQLALDVQCKTPSLLAKWLKSENASSKETRRLGEATRKAIGMTPRQYRKTLSILRQRINVLERLMSENRWSEIQFDSIPSKAGLIYKNAFAKHDVERAKAGARTYEDFAKDADAKVNAKTLYPAECVREATRMFREDFDSTKRLMTNKYWDNLENYFSEAEFNGLCVCDTSGSMTWGSDSIRPIDVAISLSLYCAERAKGPFAGHYVSFSSRPQLIKTEGVDFVDKVRRIYDTNLCDNTNIKATFDMLLDTAICNRCKQEDLMESVIIISDMEFDQAHNIYDKDESTATLMENIKAEWESAGYKCPELIFWNVDARQDNIPMKVQNGVKFVSGYSATLFDQIMKGKDAVDLMMDVLNKERYKAIV